MFIAAVIIGIIIVIFILIRLMLKAEDEARQEEIITPKVPPLTQGKSYPWFYIKDCLYYIPVSKSDKYVDETIESLMEKMNQVQRNGEFDQVIEICDQIIAKDYKFSRIWLEKVNAIFNSLLSGKAWSTSVSQNIVNSCYNYLKTFSNPYDKSVNAKHLLVPTIVKRTNDLIKYYREEKSETYNFEVYNLLINLFYLMPFGELLDVANGNIDIGKALPEIPDNKYAVDSIRSLTSHILMLKQKYNVEPETDKFDTVKVTRKKIVNDDTFSTAWIGFNIKFPNKVSNVELIFKFYDQRRQEIDLSNGGKKKFVDLFNSDNDGCYSAVILGEDRIKYVTIEVYDESKKREEELINNVIEEKSISEDIDTNKENENKIIEEQKIEELVVEEKNEINDEELDKNSNCRYKMYPKIKNIKQLALSENYGIILRDDGLVEVIGHCDKSIDTSLWEKIETVHVTNTTAYAIRKDGTITVTGKSLYDNWEYQYKWNEIQKLEPSYNHIVGLKTDGTVVAIGDNTHGQCEVKEWTDIVDISVSFHTVGLNKDGKVLAVGSNNFGECDVDTWTHIDKIATGPFFTIGLRDDGTVVSAGLNSCGQCDTNDWDNVKNIYVSGNVTVGLRHDGKVLVAGRNSYRFEDAKKWNDVATIKISNDRVIGVLNSGKINYIGRPYWGRVKEDWNDIESIEANSNVIVGKKRNGALVSN